MGTDNQLIAKPYESQCPKIGIKLLCPLLGENERTLSFNLFSSW